jgi:iron-sulfur cluster repair protein YtfE (RIC family)
MSRAWPKPDLTFVTLIHQSLRADAARLAATNAELGPSDRQGRLPGVRAFFGQYREQLSLHHSHEDELFFPALAARVGASTMHLSELAAQHEALDAALLAAGDRLAALADPASDFETDRAKAASALSAMARILDAHLTREEQTALPLFESEGRNRIRPLTRPFMTAPAWLRSRPLVMTDCYFAGGLVPRRERPGSRRVQGDQG